MIGGIVATLGVVSPSVVIITIISIFLQNFADLSVVKHAFNGIRAAVCVLIMDSVIISPVLLVVLSGVAGIVLKPVADRSAAKAADDAAKSGTEPEESGTLDGEKEDRT